MAQQYLTPALIGLFSLLFLGIGFWINSRVAASKLAQQLAELKAAHQAEHQQLLNDAALAHQREQQMLHEQEEHQRELALLSEDIGRHRDVERQLSIQLGELKASLEAEKQRMSDKVEQLTEVTTLAENRSLESNKLRMQLGELRMQVGQGQEQTRQLEELKQILAQHQMRLEAAQLQLQRQGEQLGQSTEQANQLLELKAAHANSQTRIEKAEEEFKKQREQLGQAAEQKEQLDVLRGTLVQRDKELGVVRDELSLAKQSLAEVNMRHARDQHSAAEKLQLLEDNKVQLKQEFQNLANQIFDSKQQSFSEQSRQGLDTLLKPFKDQLDSFRQRVDQVHSDTVQGQSSMKNELVKLMELNAQITTEASNLTKALKGDKKLQGTWGEQKVEMLLEQAGLRKGFEYHREANFKNDEAGNNRPDFVVNLPEGKHIIIDSKMSLVAYTEYVSAETDEERTRALSSHVLALKNHINGLSDKKYTDLNGINSPDFVFLFMPVEPAYLVAAEHSPGVFQAAYEKRIAIITATTLLPVLRVVSNLWSIQRQNSSTLQLATMATKVYDKLRVFVEKMDKLGNQIATVQKSYNESITTLKGDHGSLTKTVDKFVALGVTVSKRLPASAIGEDEELESELAILPVEGAANT
ncbi:DNA recombination protein RmuC [Pseudomonas syringae group genomosp. 3]|uniref:DNA recombination protein RmuC n=1 Tax=Pseudomonas syringae group genomosp. 3 TaxID=251701 RepID=UPI0006E56B39|nr:DNA recombination protein RmuC [Pseudomonas syringae group genomosp. 3]KPW59066.1 DNA recombination protein RmuC [Pseudomonas syringae pv. berberidis]KPY11791.1 DNA recombination protein RmuC [Pseudomonas syringae pv. philadelphi]RMM17179.1 DNA recombination protein RmuC [Pseudomonas syringae pv. berberidis]RMQ41485.1 DNA recombination protein RmuC [Pseudomonas syringae pv. berberidis]